MCPGFRSIAPIVVAAICSGCSGHIERAASRSPQDGDAGATGGSTSKPDEPPPDPSGDVPPPPVVDAGSGAAPSDDAGTVGTGPDAGSPSLPPPPPIPRDPTCSQALGSWTATMPDYAGTKWVVTFTISGQVATTGGTVAVTWASPGANTFTGSAVFSVATCSLAQSYPALCAAATAAGNGIQCGDRSSAGQDVCPGGNAMTASFSTPAMSWWDAHGCVDGQNCSTCLEHQAVSVVRN